MITLTSAQLDAWIAAFIFPLARILAMISSAPILGNKQLPRHVKVGLALMLTIIVTPNIEHIPAVPVTSAAGLLILVQQIIIGVAIGFTVRLIFTAVEMAGEIAGLQMGLGFASFYDPINATHSAVISQWFSILATLIFLSIDGHFYLLSAVVGSFNTLPIGTMFGPQGFYDLARWGSSIFMYGLQLSLPILAVLLTTNLALGVLTRAAPQLNIFAVGFPITLTVGFVVLALTLPYFVPAIHKLLFNALEVAGSLK